MSSFLVEIFFSVESPEGPKVSFHQSWTNFTLMYWFGEYCPYTASINLDYVPIYYAMVGIILGSGFLTRGRQELWSERNFSITCPSENGFLVPFSGKLPIQRLSSTRTQDQL